MNCPVCNTPLIVVEREGIELDWCLDCRGLWFDDGELALLAERTGRQLDAEDVGRQVEKAPAGKARRCPRCRRSMERAVAGRHSPVQVDRCHEHGIWLDRGELGRILSQIELGQTTDEAVIVRFLGETFQSTAPPGDAGETTR